MNRFLLDKRLEIQMRKDLDKIDEDSVRVEFEWIEDLEKIDEDSVRVELDKI